MLDWLWSVGTNSVSFSLSTLSRHRLHCCASRYFGPVGGRKQLKKLKKKALVAWLHRAGRQTGRNINRRTQSLGRQTGTQSGTWGGKTGGQASCTHQKWQRWQVCVFVYVCENCRGQLLVWIYDGKHMLLTHSDTHTHTHSHSAWSVNT